MTEAEITQCQDWLKAHAASWQVLNRAQWKYQFHPKTLVRFIEEASMREEEVKLNLEYLTSDNSIETLSLYDQSVVGYKPTKAWYEVTNRVHSGVRGVRLYQALSTSTDEEDGPYVVEDGCAWKVEHTYYWQTENEPTAPASESGISYRIESVRRDEETGLFSYVLEKRTRVMQKVEEYLKEINVFSKADEALYLGVKKDEVENTGKQASVAGGVITTRKVTKNDDCTSNVMNETVMELEVDNALVVKEKRLHAVISSVTDKNQGSALTDDKTALKVGETRRSQKTPGGLYDNTHEQLDQEEVGEIGADCEKTVFAHEDVTVTNQNNKPEQEVPEAAGGVVVKRSARQTEYGTWDVTEATRTEIPQTSAKKIYRKTLRGTIEVTEDKSQSTALNNTGMKIGESRESNMTPGGLYDNTTSSIPTEAAGLIGDSGVEDQFTREISTSENSLEKKETAPSFSKGTIVRKTSSLNNEGTADTDTRTITAKEVVHAYEWSDYRRSHTRIWYRNKTDSLAGASSVTIGEGEGAKEYKIPSDSDSLEIHETINEFGLYDGIIHYYDDESNNGNENPDYSATTTGTPVKLYDECYMPPKNIRYVRGWELQLVIYRGFGISAYDDAMSKADINRVTAGPMIVKALSGRYKDSTGTPKMDWAQVNFNKVNDWEKYDSQEHKNIRITDSASISEIARNMIP